ncbi:MAG: hypothetical protein FJZ01_23995 [Candidatus Sericytochromatia bacterium]|nr:hypothetical protein [Candidatus Tanganyikabacteria bacterium]
MNPSIICLHPVQVVHPVGDPARGVIVRLSTEEGVIRTRLQARSGDVVVLAGMFDHFLVKAAAVVTHVAANGFSFRFAAMSADARAHLARYVWARVKPHAPVERRERQIRTAQVEPSRRKPYVKWAPQLRDTDRHASLTLRWLERLPFDPGPIAPRTAP